MLAALGRTAVASAAAAAGNGACTPARSNPRICLRTLSPCPPAPDAAANPRPTPSSSPCSRSAALPPPRGCSPTARASAKGCGRRLSVYQGVSRVGAVCASSAASMRIWDGRRRFHPAGDVPGASPQERSDQPRYRSASTQHRDMLLVFLRSRWSVLQLSLSLLSPVGSSDVRLLGQPRPVHNGGRRIGIRARRDFFGANSGPVFCMRSKYIFCCRARQQKLSRATTEMPLRWILDCGRWGVNCRARPSLISVLSA